MDSEKFLEEIKYDLEFIFSYGVDVINVRFYEDEGYYEFYVNEYAEKIAYFSKPSWGDSDYQIIEEAPRSYSLLIDGKVYETFTGYEGWGGIKKLLEELLFHCEVFGHSDEIYEKGIFSGTSRDSKPLKKSQQKARAASTNIEAIKRGYREYENNKNIRGTGLSLWYGMSYNAMEAFAEGLRPREYIPPEWLEEIGWEGTLEELLDVPVVKDFHVNKEWHHMILDHEGDLRIYRVNFYDPKSLERLVNIINEERSYEEEKENVETLDEALNLGADWLEWKSNEKGGITYTYSGKNLIFLIFEEGNGYYTVRDTYWRKQDTSIENVREDEVIKWILGLIDYLEDRRNKEI